MQIECHIHLACVSKKWSSLSVCPIENADTLSNYRSDRIRVEAVIRMAEKEGMMAEIDSDDDFLLIGEEESIEEVPETNEGEGTIVVRPVVPEEPMEQPAVAESVERAETAMAAVPEPETVPKAAFADKPLPPAPRVNINMNDQGLKQVLASQPFKNLKHNVIKVPKDDCRKGLVTFKRVEGQLQVAEIRRGDNNRPGAFERLGVRVGDYLVGVNCQSCGDKTAEEIKTLCSERDHVELIFVRDEGSTQLTRLHTEVMRDPLLSNSRAREEAAEFFLKKTVNQIETASAPSFPATTSLVATASASAPSKSAVAQNLPSVGAQKAVATTIAISNTAAKAAIARDNSTTCSNVAAAAYKKSSPVVLAACGPAQPAPATISAPAQKKAEKMVKAAGGSAKERKRQRDDSGVNETQAVEREEQILLKKPKNEVARAEEKMAADEPDAGDGPADVFLAMLEVGELADAKQTKTALQSHLAKVLEFNEDHSMVKVGWESNNYKTPGEWIPFTSDFISPIILSTSGRSRRGGR